MARRVLLLFLFGTVLGVALATAAHAQPSASDPADASVVAELIALNEESAVAWNRGDLAGHVEAYADSAVFMTGRGPLVGRDRTAEALSRSFFRDGRPVQSLRFEHVTVRMLGPDHAIVVGRFVLFGGGEEDHAGWFTTVWERTNGRWEIIHDHSS